MYVLQVEYVFLFLVCRHSLTFCACYCHALHFLSTINCVDLCGHIRVLSCFIIFPVRWRPSSECSFRRYCHRCRISRRESNINETEWSVVKCSLSFLVESLQSRIFMNEVGEAFSWTNYITLYNVMLHAYNLIYFVKYYTIITFVSGIYILGITGTLEICHLCLGFHRSMKFHE